MHLPHRGSARGHAWTITALVVGALAHAVLIPRTNGADFVVWDLASKATLDGQNIYADHPSGYPGGPFAYLPLFLYLALPFQWLSGVLGVPFRVLGKVPFLVADLTVAALVALELRRRGHGDRVQAFGAALWLWNPLVVYNSAYYGRFDSVCVALVMLAIVTRLPPAADGLPHDRSYVLHGAAIATKLYPAFFLPWYTGRPREAVRAIAIAVATCLVVSLPYLLTDPGALIDDVVRYNAGKPPSNLSWQTVLRGAWSISLIHRLDLLLMVASLVVLMALRHRDLWVHFPVAVGCFLLSSNLVIEQYFVWALPFLVVLAIDQGQVAAGWLYAWLTCAGSLLNTHIHPFGRQGSPDTEWLNVVIAVGAAVGLVLIVRADHRARRTTPGRLLVRSRV